MLFLYSARAFLFIYALVDVTLFMVNVLLALKVRVKTCGSNPMSGERRSIPTTKLRLGLTVLDVPEKNPLERRKHSAQPAAGDSAPNRKSRVNAWLRPGAATIVSPYGQVAC